MALQGGRNLSVTRSVYWTIAIISLVLSLVITVVVADIGNPKISEISILLPFSRSRDFRVEKLVSVEPGCYHWHSSNEDVAKAIVPADAVAGEGGCSPRANIVGTSTRNSTQTCKVFAVSHEKEDEFGEDCSEQLTVEVYVAPIARLEILTTMRKISVNESETISVQAYDSEGNVFSSLDGIQFVWSTSPAAPHGPLEVSMLKETNVLASEASSKHNILEGFNLFGSTVQITGRNTGQAHLTVKLNEAGYEPYKNVEASILINVTEPIVTCPKSVIRPMFTALGSSIQFSYSFPRTLSRSHCHSMEQVTVTVAQGDYEWDAMPGELGSYEYDENVARVDAKSGVAVFCELGQAFVTIRNQMIANHATALVQVIEPTRLDVAYIRYDSDVSPRLKALESDLEIGTCAWRTEGKSPFIRLQTKNTSWNSYSGDEDSAGSKWVLVKGRQYLVRASLMATVPQSSSSRSQKLEELFESKDMSFAFTHDPDGQPQNSVLQEFGVSETLKEFSPGLRHFEATELGSTLLRVQYQGFNTDNFQRVCGHPSPQHNALETVVPVVVVSPVTVAKPASGTVLLPPVAGATYTVECHGGTGKYYFALSKPVDGIRNAAIVLNDRLNGKITVPENVEESEYVMTCTDRSDPSNFQTIRVLIQAPEQLVINQCEREVQAGTSLLLSVSFADHLGNEFSYCPDWKQQSELHVKWKLSSAAKEFATFDTLSPQQKGIVSTKQLELQSEGRLASYCFPRSLRALQSRKIAVKAVLERSERAAVESLQYITIFPPLRVAIGETPKNLSTVLTDGDEISNEIVVAAVANRFFLGLVGGPTSVGTQSSGDDIQATTIGGDQQVLRIVHEELSTNEQHTTERLYQVQCLRSGKSIVTVKVSNPKTKDLPCPVVVTKTFEVHCEFPVMASLTLTNIVDVEGSSAGDSYSSCSRGEGLGDSARMLKGQQGEIVLTLLDGKGRPLVARNSVSVAWEEQVSMSTGKPQWQTPSMETSALRHPAKFYKDPVLEMHTSSASQPNSMLFTAYVSGPAAQEINSLDLPDDVKQYLSELKLSATLQVEVVSYLGIRPVTHAPILLDSPASYAYFKLLGGSGEVVSQLNTTAGVVATSEVITSRDANSVVSQSIKVALSGATREHCSQGDIVVSAMDNGLPCANPVVSSVTASPIARLELQVASQVVLGGMVEARVLVFPKSGKVPFSASQYNAIRIQLEMPGSRQVVSSATGHVECLSAQEQTSIGFLPVNNDLASCPGVWVVTLSGVEIGTTPISARVSSSCVASGSISSYVHEIRVFGPLEVRPSNVVLSPCSEVQLELSGGPLDSGVFVNESKDIKCRFDASHDGVLKVSPTGLLSAGKEGVGSVMVYCELIDLETGAVKQVLAQDSAQVQVSGFRGIRLLHQMGDSHSTTEYDSISPGNNTQRGQVSIVQGEEVRLRIEGDQGEKPGVFDPALENSYSWSVSEESIVSHSLHKGGSFGTWVRGNSPGFSKVVVRMTTMVPGKSCARSDFVSRTMEASMKITVVPKLVFKVSCTKEPILLPVSSHYPLRTSLDESHPGQLRYSVIGTPHDTSQATEVLHDVVKCPDGCTNSVDETSAAWLLRVDPGTGMLTTGEGAGTAVVVVSLRAKSGENGGEGEVIQTATLHVEVAQIAGLGVKFHEPFHNTIPLGRSGRMTVVPHDSIGREFHAGARLFPTTEQEMESSRKSMLRSSHQQWIAPDGSVEILPLASSDDRGLVGGGGNVPFWSYSIHARKRGMAISSVWLPNEKRTELYFGHADESAVAPSLLDYFSIQVVNVVLPGENPIRLLVNSGTVELGLATGSSTAVWESLNPDLFTVDSANGMVRVIGDKMGAGVVRVSAGDLVTTATVHVDVPRHVKLDVSTALANTSGKLYDADDMKEFVFPVVLVGSSQEQDESVVWNHGAKGRIDQNLAVDCVLDGDKFGLFQVRSVSSQTAFREYDLETGTPACVVSVRSRRSNDVREMSTPEDIVVRATVKTLNGAGSTSTYSTKSDPIRVLDAFDVVYLNVQRTPSGQFQPGCILLSPTQTDASIELRGDVRDVTLDASASGGRVRVEEATQGSRIRNLRISATPHVRDFSGATLVFKHPVTGQTEAVCVSYTSRSSESASSDVAEPEPECEPKSVGQVCDESQTFHCQLCDGPLSTDNCVQCDFVSMLVSDDGQNKMTCQLRPGVLWAVVVVVVPGLTFMLYFVAVRLMDACIRSFAVEAQETPVTPRKSDFPLPSTPNRQFRRMNDPRS